MTKSRGGLVLAALLTSAAWTCPADAHVASNSFLVAQVSGQEIVGSVELAVRDAELAVGLDADGDGRVTWGELRAAEPKVAQYIQQHLAFIAQNDTCDLHWQGMQVDDRVDGTYAWLPFAARCRSAVRELEIRYSVMEGIDPSHRALLTLTAGDVTQTGVLGGSTPQAAFSVYAPSLWRSFVEYFQAGVWHILSGIDHLLFLLSLLLPAVLWRKGGQWEPVTELRPALVSIFKVVTAFTLAHSLTLTLAALNIVRLPTRLTESVIAASIIVAALNNIVPVVTESRARIAFGFGLLHGFGFASVLADMGLPRGTRLTSLLSFNLGIETGQLAVVCIAVPVIYALRSGVFYRRAVMPWGSAAIAAMAMVWLVQRALFPSG